MEKKKKILYIVIGIVILLVVSVASTYAYYLWTTDESNETKIVTDVGAATIYFNGGSSLSNSTLRPVDSKKNGLIKEIRVKSSVNNNIKFNLYLDVNSLGEDNGLREESLRFEFYKGSELAKEGNFGDEYLTNDLVSCTKNNTNHIVLLENEAVTTTEVTYTLYIWIDNSVLNPSTMQNQSYDFNLHVEGENAIIKESILPDGGLFVENSLAHNLLETYKGSTKTYTMVNSVKYHLDEADRLMTDYMGNIRFYGADDENDPDDLKNYIYFNCDDYNTQDASTCEMWRIIGVFDGKVKLIRDTNTAYNADFGKYVWDYDYNDGEGKTTSSNDWTKSSLKNLLNGAYYNNDDTQYYNNSTTPTDVKFETNKTGIRNEATQKMIAEVRYNLGGWISSSIYVDEMYGYERGTKVYSSKTPTYWIGKIALAYPSDYGYAVDLSQCKKTLSSYYSSSGTDGKCANNNWMKTLYARNGYNWFLSPNSDYSYYAFIVSSSGTVDNLDYVYSARGFPPVLYLESKTSVKAGDGSSDNPFQIAVVQTS